MNQTMKYSLIAAVVMLIGLIFAAYLVYDAENVSAPSEIDSISEQLGIDENASDVEAATRTLDNFDPISQPVTELGIVDLSEGSGEVVSETATVTAHYTGAFAVNGEIFESSYDTGNPATFPLSNVIPGWQEGVPGMQVGGTRRLIIPGELAYGAAPEGYEPGSSGRPLGPLVFDIELVAVEE